MIGAVGLVNDMGDTATFINDKGHSVGDPEQAFRCADQAATTQRPIGRGYRTVGIGQQRKVDAILFGEAPVRVGISVSYTHLDVYKRQHHDSAAGCFRLAVNAVVYLSIQRF